MDDFVNAIAYEVKAEIASRYFGFRAQIEMEMHQFQEKLGRAERDQLSSIRLDILRMRSLLHRERFISDFLLIAGLPASIAGDSFRGQPAPEAAELFAGLKGEGFSRWRRYRDLAFRVYRSLSRKISTYVETRLDLVDEYVEICARIDGFHRNNDLTGILSFLRTFDSSDSERLKFLHAVSAAGPDLRLDQDLRIPHPRPVSDILPTLPALPQLKQVKTALIALLKSAYACHDPSQTALPV